MYLILYLFAANLHAMSLIGVKEAAVRMRKNVRWLYRHLGNYETKMEDIPTIRIVWDDKNNKAVKSNTDNT